MSDFIIANARIITLDVGDLPRRGDAMENLGVIENGYVLVIDGKINQVQSGSPDEAVFEKSDELVVIDAEGRVVMPTFVDCHTHTCWTGSRLNEFEDPSWHAWVPLKEEVKKYKRQMEVQPFGFRRGWNQGKNYVLKERGTKEWVVGQTVT